jgi:pilus assembly protein Flp/PilA
MKRKYLSPTTTLAQDTNSFKTLRNQEYIITMKHLILRIKALRDTSGQDLIEYALMAGFVAVVAGAILPGVATSISTIFSQIGSVMTAASTQG